MASVSTPVPPYVPETAIAAAATTESPLDQLDASVFSEIVSFVGDHNYRFVAGINRRFQQTYSEVFRNDRRTLLTGATVEHSKICWEEMNRDRPEFQHRLCSAAVEHGNLQALQYLRSTGINCKWDASTCASAARTGRLDLLQWCREMGCPWDNWTCYYAAGTGNLNLLQWCRNNGCPWDEMTCSGAAAAKGGHLTVLKWC